MMIRNTSTEVVRVSYSHINVKKIFVKIEIICPSVSHKSSDYDFQALCVTITSPVSAQMFYTSSSLGVLHISQRIRDQLSWDPWMYFCNCCFEVFFKFKE